MNRQNTILCISENLYVLYEMVSAFRGSGYQTICAGSYGRAASLVLDEKIDAIVIVETAAPPDGSMYAYLKSLRPDTPILLQTKRPAISSERPAGIDLLCSASDVQQHLEKLLSSTVTSNLQA